MLKQCNTCNGVYDTVGPDGVTYAHVCPPVHGVKVQHLDGTLEIVRPAAVLPTDIVLGDVMLMRRNARNENPDVSQRPDAKGAYPMISAGAGVTAFVPGAVAVNVPGT